VHRLKKGVSKGKEEIGSKFASEGGRGGSKSSAKVAENQNERTKKWLEAM
jgi:hypothetical protein